MKPLMCLLLVSAYYCHSLNIPIDILSLIPKNICEGFPTGTAFPVAYDCNQFILCVGNTVTLGKCSLSHPYFDPCTSRCETRSYVCFRTICVETTTGIEEPIETEAPEEPVDPCIIDGEC